MNALLLTALLIGQCPGGVCPVTPQQIVSTYEWREVPNHPDVKALARDGVQIGAYDGDVYRPYANGVWGEPTNCPVMIPSAFMTKRAVTKMLGQLPEWQTSGVDWNECGKRSGNSFKGEPIDRNTAYEMLQAGNGTIPDVSKKPMVSFVDVTYEKADARRKEFLKHDIASHYNVQAYSKDDPVFKRAVDPAKVKTIPTVYFQVSPSNGKVTERVDGDVPVERIIEAAKRHDVNYDPSKDPTGENPLNAFINKYVTKESIIALVTGILIMLGLVKRPTPPTPTPAKV